MQHPRRDELLALPVFTVGDRTAEAARAAGFSRIASADGGWPDLVRLVAGELKGIKQPLLYLAAEQRSGDIAGALASHGLAVETVVIYRAVPNPDLTQELRAAFADRLDGALHYSRRSAQTFLVAARSAGLTEPALRLAHYCLSSEVAAPLTAAGATNVKIAPHPDEAALIELLSFR
jgi:uroporphyrinogen-III synthase